MKKLLVPVVFAVAGLGAGVAGGVVLKPSADVEGQDGHAAAKDKHAAAPAKDDGHGKPPHAPATANPHEDGSTEFVTLKNQFIVPVLDRSRVQSLVVIGLDLEVAPGTAMTVTQSEPKIRDAFLTTLFDHANAGGFSGAFTSSGSLDILRTALREAAQKAVGERVVDVLITSIVRQET